MTRTGEQLLARFFFPRSSLPALIRFFHSPPHSHPLSRSSPLLFFHPPRSLILLIFHPLNKKSLPDFPTSLVLPSPLHKKCSLSRRRLRRSPRPAAGDSARTGCGDVSPPGCRGRAPAGLRRETAHARGAGAEPLPGCEGRAPAGVRGRRPCIAERLQSGRRGGTIAVCNRYFRR